MKLVYPLFMKLIGTGESTLALFRILLYFNELYFLTLNVPFKQKFRFVLLNGFAVFFFFFSLAVLVQTVKLADFLTPKYTALQQ